MTAYALDRLAQRQLTTYLRNDAAHALALAASGGTPYHWRFHSAQDIVAGCVFGAQNFAFHNAGLDIESSGSAFEIGLPLLRPLDMQRFPHVRISAIVDAPAQLRFVVRERLDAPELVSAPIALAPGRNDRSLDLAKLTWVESSSATTPPERAAMLRLRIGLAAHQTLHLQAVALDRVDGAQPVDLALAPRVVTPGAIMPPDVTSIYRLNYATRIPVRSTPLILLAQNGRVEQQLERRDAILNALPAAIPIPENAIAATFAQARVESAHAADDSMPAMPRRWLALCVFIAMLVGVRLRPPKSLRLRALAEIVLVMLVPLWLIIGQHFDGHPDVWQSALIGVMVVFAISLGFPRTWRWNGSMRAWLLAGGVVMLAAILGWIGHIPGAPLRPIDSGHVVRYLAWALLQQYLICAICTERWRVVSGNAAVAVYLGALGFALMHTPNATLMLATLCGGVCWCALYLRERALLPLAVSHAASAMLLLALLPPDILLSAETGIRFLR